MKIIHLLKLACTALFIMGAVTLSNDAEAQFGKKLRDMANKAGGKKEKKKKAPAPYAEDFSDPKGVSGTYYSTEGWGFQDKMGRTVKQHVLKFQFIEKDGDKFVNDLYVYYNAAGVKGWYYLDEKDTKKIGTRAFRLAKDTRSYWLIELEEGVYAEVFSEEAAAPFLRGDSEKVTDVLAKDSSKLSVYDMDVAQAKYEQIVRKGLAKEDEKIRSRLMEYKAYKENVGKVVFVNDYRVFNYRYQDKPNEDPKKFIKSATMGDALYLGAYFENKIGTACGADCQLNIVYEMNGKTGDRVALRNESAKWNRMISAKKITKDFCYNKGHQLISPNENIIDYAFMYTLFQNKDNLVEGKDYKLNVKAYSNRDGNNEAQIAEGSIMLKYSKEKMDNWFKHFREFYDE